MNLKISLILLFLIVLSSVAYSQSVKISPKKVVYQRTNPETPDWKREFEITYPVITSRLNAPIKKNLRQTLSYWRIFKTPFKELLDNHWTTNLDYKVFYNKNRLLSISFTWDGVGAYPDSSTKHLLVDLGTGKQVGVKNLFKNESLPRLLTKITRSIRRRENEERKKNACFAKNINTYREIDGAEEFHPVPEKITYKDLNEFFVADQGVTFLYDYNFAHVVEACEPEEEYFFNWAELKPFIKPGGLLARFVR